MPRSTCLLLLIVLFALAAAAWFFAPSFTIRLTVPGSLPIVAPTSSGGVIIATSAPNAPQCPGFQFTCSQLTCEQAYACMNAGAGDLDRDKDGIPCEAVCGG